MARLTIRNLPDDLHARLKDRARKNRRSLNQEVIAELSVVIDEPETESDRIERARERMRKANAEIEKIRRGMTRFLTRERIRSAIQEGRA